MHPARGRDPRVDKIRRHLREGTTIPKEDLLDFVNVYPRFWESGWKVRSGLVKWINRNSETVLGWFPDILKARPGYFEDPRSGTRASTYDGYETFVALGLAGQSSPRPTDLGVNATSPPSSSDPDMPPTRPKQKTLSDFGARMPDSACQKRPSLAEMVQQQVWLEDITEAHKRLKKLKKWLVQVAEGLGHDDGWKDLLSSAAETIPDLSDRVETAQLCFEDVKLNYEKSCAEQARKRAELSRTTRYSPSLGADDDDAPSSAPVEEKEDLSSIRVESDIIGVVTHTTPITPRTSTSATFANAQFGHIQSPATKSNNPPFPRRSVMPHPTHPNVASSGKEKRPRPLSNNSSSVNSIADSDSDNEMSASASKPANIVRSVYSIEDSENEAGLSRPKRARVSMGEARRPPRTHSSSAQGKGTNVPEAVMG